MAVGYEYALDRPENGWWLVRFPRIPEALAEGELEEEARSNAIDYVITALEGYMKAGRPISRPSAPGPGRDRAVLPSLVTAKLAVYETMRKRGWSKIRLAKELGVPENSMRRLLGLSHSSQMGIVWRQCHACPIRILDNVKSDVILAICVMIATEELPSREQ
jgi:antitoxin HicB